jgi:hypothetical protein
MLSPANPGNNSEVYNYTANGYVIYNLIGGVGTGRHLNDVISAPTGTNRPIGKIASCQGFFVRGINNGNATFTNEMRDNSIATENQQFYRGTGTGMIPTVPKNRFWLSLQNLDGTYQKELLIGYMPQRTVPAEGSYAGYNIPASLNSYDKMYDTELIKTMYNEAIEVNNRLEFYSMIDAANACPRLTIQGRNSQFLLNDVIPLGFSCPPGTYTINAQTSEGIFPVTQRYWLRENVGNGFVFWDIINTPFEFTTNVAIADNTTRFQIVFKLPAIDSVTSITCNTTLTNINSLIGATGQPSNNNQGYRWRFTNAAGTTTFLEVTTAISSITFTNPNIPFGFIDFGMTYFLRVGVFNSSINDWVFSATPCPVSTPPRVIKVANKVCGSTILPNEQVLASGNAPYGYAWQIKNVTSNQTVFFTTANAFFNWTAGGAGSAELGLAGFLAPGSQYNIQVAILYQATPQIIGAYSGNCYYNSPAPRPVVNNESDTNAFSDFKVKAFPNPFETDFNIAIDTESPSPIKIDVYDMIGKMMESKVVPFDEISTFKFGNDYSTGIYNVIVTQGNIRKNVKLIKR